MTSVPAASKPAAPPNHSLPESPALSILLGGPDTFAGRKLGLLVTDGAPAAVVKGLVAAVKAERATMEVIAPTIDGVDLDDGTHLDAQQMVRGGPSVLYDAVAIATDDAGAAGLALLPEAKSFVSDAHNHKKFIGHVPSAQTLLAAAGIADMVDGGYVDLARRGATKQFLTACRAVRFWDRN